jgi:glycosyltransferase involved in cell wall biosynthesis
VAPGDAGALAEAVRRLREDEALRRRLSGAAREFAAANIREDGVRHLEALLRAARGAVE